MDGTNFDPTPFIVAAVVGGLIAGAIASSKGLGFFGYFLAGAMLPLLGIVLAIVAQPPGGRVLGQLTPAEGQGWWRDPTGRFEHRYYDGRAWTRHVGRGGQRFEDPL